MWAKLDATDKRKKMAPENLCNAIMCADNDRLFPVSAEELKAASEELKEASP